LTALPINRDTSGRICIRTNQRYSITDGQRFLETSSFNAVSPTMNAGISVLGWCCSTKLNVKKNLAVVIRLALAQYRVNLAAFAQFASDLDEATRKQLEHGKNSVLN